MLIGVKWRELVQTQPKEWLSTSSLAKLDLVVSQVSKRKKLSFRIAYRFPYPRN